MPTSLRSFLSTNAMVQEISQLKNLNLKQFVEAVLNDWYPELFHELSMMDDCIHILKRDYELDIIDTGIKKVYHEFDELYRKEKMVIFPYLMKLEDEHKKPENAAPFQGLKHHHNAMIKSLLTTRDALENLFVTEGNEACVERLLDTIEHFKAELEELQHIKEEEHYIHC